MTSQLGSALTAAGVVPVVALDDPAAAVPLARALAAGGVATIEVTFRTAAAADAIRRIAAEVPGMLVGAGTVLRTAQADEAIAAGAAYVVAPGLNPAVVAHVLGRGVPMVPGVATPSEVERALELGLDLLKLFPAGPLGGPAYLRALAGPYPAVRFVPTGGIDADALAGYLALPNVAAVGGTWLTPRDAVAAGDWGTIERLARDARTVVAAR